MASFFNTTDKIKAWLKVTNSGDNAIIDDLAEAVDQRFFSELGEDFIEQAYSEKYDGNGQTKLWLRHRPVTAVSSLKINEVVVAAAPDSLSAGFLFDTDQLYLVQGTRVLAPNFQFTDRFSRGQQNISVDYMAGVSAANAPKDLVGMHLKQVSYEYRERDRIGTKSKTLGSDQTVSFITDAWAPGVLETLKKYKNVIPE